MISFLRGTLASRGRDAVFLEVGGIGYKVFISEKTFSTLPKIGSRLKLYTHLYLRDDKAELYGFLTFRECQLFETLNDISGIGPRTALVLSSFGSLEQLKEAIERDPSRFSHELKGKGIGKKKIQKLVLEITGRIREETMSRILRARKKQEQDEALDALVSLGIAKHKARELLSRIPDHTKDTVVRIKEALRLLGR